MLSKLILFQIIVLIYFLFKGKLEKEPVLDSTIPKESVVAVKDLNKVAPKKKSQNLLKESNKIQNVKENQNESKDVPKIITKDSSKKVHSTMKNQTGSRNKEWRKAEELAGK